MATNTKHTSARVASRAAEVLRDPSTSATAKRLAGSALSQRGTPRQTGADLEDLAARVLRDERYAAQTKELAASVLAQSNKQR